MANQYSLSETFSNVYSLLLTKLFYKGARLIRRPFYCRGKAGLHYEKGLTTGYHCRFDISTENELNKKRLVIGKNCKMGDNVHIVAHELVMIGDNCLMASKIFISDTNHGDYSNRSGAFSPDTIPDERELITKAVNIGNNVWIGENVCILSGVDIGDGCIIGANSLVKNNIPANCIVAGSPAKIIKYWDLNSKQWVRS